MEIGDVIRIQTDNDNDCYDKFRGLDLAITHIARNTDEHPGYDEGMNGMALVDSFVCETGEDVPFSLYSYEFQIQS